jgi:hypothetical protein
MKVFVDKKIGHPVKIEQSKMQRDWMDETHKGHAYRCFPISQANTVGWSVSFLHDIEFVWDGVCDTLASHVTILKDDGKVCHTERANATISFDTGLFFKTDQNISIISIPPANYFIDGAMAFTSVISTSFFQDSYPISWKITRPNVPIKILAGTPIATLIPLSIGSLCEIELEINNKIFTLESIKEINKKDKAWKSIYEKGGFANFYRNAVKYDNSTMGSHEKKSIKMPVNDLTKIKPPKE